jgi:hypothetical protein
MTQRRSNRLYPVRTIELAAGLVLPRVLPALLSAAPCRSHRVSAGYIWWATNKRTGITTVPFRRATLRQRGVRNSLSPLSPARKYFPPSVTRVALRVEQASLLRTGLPGRLQLSFQEPRMTPAEQIAWCLANP